MSQLSEPSHSELTDFLDGQLLIAMPSMTDQRFEKSVIYLCAHSEEGAMGLIINHHADNITFETLLERLEITTTDQPIVMPSLTEEKHVHFGGPVETGRGFVLHSTDYFVDESTLEIDEETSLTATIDILKAIAGGTGPDRSILALGYAGWSSGQLESEIQANGWLHCPADPDLVFDPNIETKYERALAKIGIDPSRLVNDAGHA